MAWNEAGLSQAEAAIRLQTNGPNELEEGKKKDFWHTVLEILAEPMFLLLLAAAGIYLLLGDIRDGTVLGLFALFSVGMVILQQRRSERALDALRALSAPQARVMRDGEPRQIPAREVVPGDLLLLAEGERIAADAVVRRASELAVDESILTGESVPVRKLAADEAVPTRDPLPGGDDLPYLFAGTLAVAGHGLAEVTTTGRRSQIGQIGATLASIAPEPTLLEGIMRKFVRIFSVLALLISSLLVLWYGLQRGDWMQGLLSGIAFAMSLLPQEFPMTLAIFLALGSWRLAQAKVLVRRSAVIETLGAATLLCVDKTGTLTENRMRVSALVAGGKRLDVGNVVADLPEELHRLLEYAVLASRRKGIDPMDAAVVELGHRTLASTEHLHPDWQLEQEFEITPQLLAMSRRWILPDGPFAVAAKGAPEAIADLCHFDAARTQALLAEVQALAAQGLRVIAVASSSTVHTAPPATPPDEQHDFEFSFEGLIGLADPLRASVPEAVATAHAAGIKVAMITGDYPATALAIARQAGIETAAGALTGREVEAMNEETLRTALAEVRVFARIMPAQKLRLVETLKGMGEVVAMTGDGVNDAPALKAAHIGIAMGVRGTDVAREAASVVLLDEDFGRIVGGVHMGRRIFENLRKVISYITAIHVPIAGLALLPVVMGMPPLLLPMHVALLEMLIDPMCSIAFEAIPPDRDLMRRPPRRTTDMLVGLPLLRKGVIHGLAALGAIILVYWVSLQLGHSENLARTLAIVCLMAANVGLVSVTAGALGAGRPAFGSMHKSFWIILSAAAGLFALGLLLPSSRELLRFALPSIEAALLAASAGFGAVLLSALPGMRAGAQARPG
ncbi:MAG TPA: HAD-IC family P-type ATPase [Rhodocyclaceae bacterium]